MVKSTHSNRKSEVKAATDRMEDLAAAKEGGEASLREELRKERQQREARERVNRELEERYSSELSQLADQLRERDHVLHTRESELSALKSEVRALTSRFDEMAAAKERAEASLQEELRKERQQREARETANRELEERHASELKNLARQLGEKDEFLKSRDGEALTLKTQIASLAEQLGKVESAKERGALLLQEKIRNEKQLREGHDSALKELEDDLRNKIRSFETQLNDRELLIKDRDADLLSVKKQLGELMGSKDQATRMLQEEIRKKSEELAEREAHAKALEDRFSERVRSLESELRERREQLSGREGELAGLTAKVESLTSQLAHTGASKDQATRMLQEEIRKKSEELAEREAHAKALEDRRSEE